MSKKKKSHPLSLHCFDSEAEIKDFLKSYEATGPISWGLTVNNMLPYFLHRHLTFLLISSFTVQTALRFLSRSDLWTKFVLTCKHLMTICDVIYGREELKKRRNTELSKLKVTVKLEPKLWKKWSQTTLSVCTFLTDAWGSFVTLPKCHSFTSTELKHQTAKRVSQLVLLFLCSVLWLLFLLIH